jgi:putative ABC transport system permease protein
MGILHDLRSAVRALRAQTGLTLTIVAILSVAIGANAAVFALVDVTLLAPLPFPDDSRLVTVNQTRADSAREPLSIADYRDLRDGSRSFEGMGAAFQWSANLTGGEAERLQGMKASASLFAILRSPAALGRVLVPEDEIGDGRRVAILSHGLWIRRYGADPNVLGSALVLNGDAYTVVGVLPRSFITPVRDAEVVVPFAMEADPRRTLRDSGFLRVLGRLRPGVTIEQARAELDGIMQRLRLEHPTTNATHLGTAIVEWRRALAANQRPLLLLLQAAVALVLVVACANVANLLLAAAVRREHEFAVRAAIGGSRSRLIRQLSFEALLVSAAAMLGAIAIQLATAQTLSVLAPPDLLASAEFARSGRRILAFTSTAALLATAIFALVPVRRLGTASGTLRAGPTSAPATRRVRNTLVTAEVAIASLLVTIAVLLSQSFGKLQAVETGFRADGLLTARLSLPRSRYHGAEDAARFIDALRPRLLALPGVEDAAAVNVVPLNGYHATADVWPSDRPAPDPGSRPQAQYRMITPSFLRTFGVPLLAGRAFDEHDTRAAEPVVLVSRTLAVRFWTVPGAVGRMLTIEDGETPRQARVAGVVGDVKHYGLDAESTADLYTPVPQVPDVTVQWLNNNMYWGIRTAGDPAALGDSFRRALREVDADVPAAAIRTMHEALAIALAPRRLNLTLVQAFAVIALLLAAAGVYAVTAFSVALRRREIAIRSVLGAGTRRTLSTVVGDALRPVVAGLIAGAAGALVASPFLRAVLFQVEPVAPGPLSLVSAVLFAAALTAALVAALPIRHIEAVEALQSEPR